MTKTHIDSDRRDQLRNASSTESDTNSLFLSAQQTSPRENKPSSSDKLYPILQAAFETGLMIVGLLYVALFLPRQLGVDGEERYKDLLHLFSTHNLFQPHSKYSLIGPLFSTPLWLIGKQLGYPQS